MENNNNNCNHNNDNRPENNTFQEMLKYYFTYKIIGNMFSKPRPQPYKKDRGISLTAFIICLTVFYLVFIR